MADQSLQAPAHDVHVALPPLPRDPPPPPGYEDPLTASPVLDDPAVAVREAVDGPLPEAPDRSAGDA
jgi:hypothetical protein